MENNKRSTRKRKPTQEEIRLHRKRQAEGKIEKNDIGTNKPLMSSLVLVRNMLRTDLFKKLALSQMIMSTAVLLSVILSYSAFTQDPVIRFIAIGSDGLVFEINAVDQPIWTDEQVLGKATTSLVESFNFNYKNYRQSLSKAFWRHYTRAGELTFRDALKEAGIIEFVKSNKAIVTAIPTNVGIIVNKTALQGHAAWVIQIPITITYSTSKGESSKNSIVEITLVRVKVSQSVSGIGVTKFIFLN